MTDELPSTLVAARYAYSPSVPVDLSSMVSLGRGVDLGMKVLEGNPEAWIRVDFHSGGMTAGLFRASRGKVEYTFASTEHATILEGELTLTDQTGEVRTYRPGDSYFFSQGQVVVWDVQADHVTKSFFSCTD